MINSVRTWLLNFPGVPRFPGEPGEEYTSPEYLAKKLPTWLATMRQALFGGDPDRLYMNYRMAQIAEFLHAGELAGYTTLSDRRVTYWPGNVHAFDDAFQQTVTQTAGVPVETTLLGVHAADPVAGRCRQRWIVSRLSDYELRIILQLPRNRTFDAEYVITNDLSQPILLPGSSLSLQFRTPSPGTEWRIAAAARPATDFADVMRNLDRLVHDREAVLFENTASGFRHLHTIWEDHPLDTHRYAAALLAMAYRIGALTETKTQPTVVTVPADVPSYSSSSASAAVSESSSSAAAPAEFDLVEWLLTTFIWVNAYAASRELYIDAGVTPAEAENDLIYHWGDLSGNGHHILNAVAGDRPKLMLTGMNGRPAVYFDGTNLLKTLTNVPAFAGKRGALVAVIENDASTGYGPVASEYDGAVAMPFVTTSSLDGTLYSFLINGAWVTTALPDISLVRHVKTWWRDSDTTVKHRRDGAASDNLTIADVQSSSAPVAIGAHVPGVAFFTGKISFLGVLSGVQ